MGDPGTHYCLQCQQYFCGICKAQHNRQRVSRNHEFQSVENVDQEVKLRCEEHEEDFENGKTQTNQAEILPVRSTVKVEEEKLGYLFRCNKCGFEKIYSGWYELPGNCPSCKMWTLLYIKDA